MHYVLRENCAGFNSHTFLTVNLQEYPGPYHFHRAKYELSIYPARQNCVGTEASNVEGASLHQNITTTQWHIYYVYNDIPVNWMVVS